MSIGTSRGAYYDDAFHQAAAQWNPQTYDDNIVSPLVVQKTDDVEYNTLDPKIMMGNKMTDDNPKNIYDDQGNIVDYDLK